jgi:hypothetical protein
MPALSIMPQFNHPSPLALVFSGERMKIFTGQTTSSGLSIIFCPLQPDDDPQAHPNVTETVDIVCDHGHYYEVLPILVS